MRLAYFACAFHSNKSSHQGTILLWTAIAMPSHSSEIAYEKRVAVIALRMLSGDTFVTIANKLNLRQQSVNRIYLRAIGRTEISLRNSFDAVVQSVKDAPRPGRPTTLPRTSASMDVPGHAVAKYIYSRVQNGPQHDRSKFSHKSRPSALLEKGLCQKKHNKHTTPPNGQHF